MDSPRSFFGHRILSSLPANEARQIRPDLHRVYFELGETVYTPDAVLAHLYFPITAVLSVVKVLENGSAVEIETVGREGVMGFQAFFGATHVWEKTVVQIPGVAYCMPFDKFQSHSAQQPTFNHVLNRYIQSAFFMMSQSIACNRLHHVNERCARWLLLTHDRVGRNEFPMTHEFLSMMLGVNRPTVSTAASTLQNAGYISYGRGVMTVVDRAGLESASCECYAATTRMLNTLLPIYKNTSITPLA